MKSPLFRDLGAGASKRPGKRLILHVGAPKTGTTFLQEVLWHNRADLARSGIGYPLEDPREHFAATMDLRQMTWGGGRDPAWRGAWDRVAARARSWSGPTVVISNELLGGANPAQIKRAVESLAPAEICIAFTARDLARQLPSDWQEQVKHTHTVTFDEFIDDLAANELAAKPPFGEMFWGLHDPVHVLRPWADVVGADHVYVITVPHGRWTQDALWRRFSRLLGLQQGEWDLNAARTNPSLGAVEAELLRRVNARARGGEPPVYDDVLRARIIDAVLLRREGQARIAFPERHLEWVRKRSQELIDGVRDAGYNVIGDLADLQPKPGVAEAADPAGISDAELLNAALDALAGMLVKPATSPDPAARQDHGSGRSPSRVASG